jgi:O-phosphoseryl-tRNA(Cys) synthetase
MASDIFVLESGRILVSLFFGIGKRVTIMLPMFFYQKLAQSLLNMGLERVVTPPSLIQDIEQYIKENFGSDAMTVK